MFYVIFRFLIILGSEKSSKRIRHRPPTQYLLKRVGAGSPVGKEQAEANSFENTGKPTNKDGVKRALLSEHLGDNLEHVSQKCSTTSNHLTYRRSSRSEENQRAKVSSALVGEGTGSVDQSTNTVRLDSRADNGASPRSGSSGGLLAVEVLLLGVCLLCATVRVTKDGAEDSEGDGVVEGRAKGNGRGLDGRKVYQDEN